MARPKQYSEDRKQAQIRFQPETHDRLKALAEARMVSLAYLVEQAVLIQLPVWEAETPAKSNGKVRKATPAKATAKTAKTPPPAKAASKTAARPRKVAATS